MQSSGPVTEKGRGQSPRNCASGSVSGAPRACPELPGAVCPRCPHGQLRLGVCSGMNRRAVWVAQTHWLPLSLARVEECGALQGEKRRRGSQSPLSAWQTYGKGEAEGPANAGLGSGPAAGWPGAPHSAEAPRASAFQQGVGRKPRPALAPPLDSQHPRPRPVPPTPRDGPTPGSFCQSQPTQEK